MNVLSRLWRAVAGLAGPVEANGQLRRLAIGGPGEDCAEVIDNTEALPAPRRYAKKAPA